MGLLRAITSAISGSMKDQWKEMFYCNSIPNNILLVKGQKMKSEKSANNGSDNVITDGSLITVADGEAAIVVCNGRVTSVFCEPGEHIFSSKSTAGVFSGPEMGSAADNVLSDIGRRISFGGDVPIVYRVYYMNTKEILGNPINIGSIPFRILDTNTGLDLDATVSINGVYSIKIVDPLLIYTNIIGNVEKQYFITDLANQLRAEISSQILTSITALSKDGLRASGIPALAPALSQAVKDSVNPWLRENRGVEIASFPIGGIHVSESDMSTISSSQMAKALSDPALAAGYMVNATADAIKSAAK